MKEFDEPPYDLMASIKAAISEIRARPIPISLDASGIFGGSRHLVLTSSRINQHLKSLVGMLYNKLTEHNLPRFPLKSFEPHVTVIYGCGKIDLLPVEQPYIWIAEDFLLVYSHQGEGRHEEFGRWRLDPDAPPYSLPPEQLRLMI